MTLITSKAISTLGIELLRRSLVLPLTTTRISDGEYSGPSGGTVTLPVPVPRSAREQLTPGSEITLDELDEQPTDVTLRHFYDATAVTDPAWTHDLTDFGRQVLRPQVDALAVRAENVVAATLNTLEPDAIIEWSAVPSVDSDRATILAIREQMTVRGVPADGRHLAVAPDIATRLLTIPEFVRAGDRGNATALESATIGRVYGLDVVESPSIVRGTAVGYHTSGIAYGNPRPAIPSAAGMDAGAGAASVTDNESGLAMRTILSYDVRHLQTVSVVSTFIGAAPVLDGGDPVALAVTPSGNTINTVGSHGLVAGDQVRFTSLNGGEGLYPGTTYYVVPTGLTGSAFRVSPTPAGAAVSFVSELRAGTVRSVGRCRRAIRVATAT